MSSKRNARPGRAPRVVVVAIVLLIVLKSGNSDSSDNDRWRQAADDRRQERQAGRRDQRSSTYNKGEQIRFKVDSDVSDEVHVHGYDIMKDVKAGGSVTFDFPATIEGVFEAELEGRKEQIIELTVNP